MTTRSDHDPFDLGFEADDDFATTTIGTPSAAGLGGDDPFVDFPSVRPRETVSAPFGDLPPPAAPYAPRATVAAPAPQAALAGATGAAPIDAAEPFAQVAHPVGTTQALVQ